MQYWALLKQEVNIDIAGAFDNLWWPKIFERLRVAGCPMNLYKLVGSYLQGRKVVVNSHGRFVEYTKGCPQGSVFSPLMCIWFWTRF